MPYIVTTSSYPNHKAAEVAKAYIEAIQKYPLDESLGTNVVPSAVKACAEGIRVVGIVEVKKEKLFEAYNRAVNMMVMFLGIEGYRWEIDIYYKVEEALSLIGMSLPE